MHNPDKTKINKRPHHLKTLQAQSPKDEILKKFYSQKGNMKRFDREFTLSWAHKQLARLSSPKDFVPQPKVAFRPSTHSSGCLSPPRVQNPNLALHLSGEKDEERLGTKIYEENVYELRQQNEDNIIQTLNTKNQYKDSFNRMAQQFNLQSYRSDMSSTRLGLSKSCNYSPKASWITQSQQTDNGKAMETNLMTEETQVDCPPLAKSYYFNTEPKEASPVLGSLEEIYLKDVKAETVRTPKRLTLDNSPYKTEYLRKGRCLRKTMIEGEYKHLLDDKMLMRRFEDPYAKHLPFEKPIHANIKNPKNVKLQELEMKAEILRSIKSIHEGMVNNYNQDFSKGGRVGEKFKQLPQI